ncbi:MAG: hypothetical protein K0S70_3218 [Microbacterium sp.]|jgi:hypothetical protein|nr:hypothetical protein [Microbacterium sp.]
MNFLSVIVAMTLAYSAASYARGLSRWPPSLALHRFHVRAGLVPLRPIGPGKNPLVTSH